MKWYVPAVLLAVLSAGCASTSKSIVVPAAQIPSKQFKITDYGAVGDDKTLNTEAFAKAIDACRQAGGGEIVVPTGGTYLTGPMTLSSSMALVIEKGATIHATDDFAAYGQPQAPSDDFLLDEYRPLVKPIIGADGATDIAIRGGGVIDGSGKKWWDRVFANKKAGAPSAGQRPATTSPATVASRIAPRPRIVLFRDCKRVNIDGVTLKDSPNFNIALFRCQDVLIENTTITAPGKAPNTDGIDPGNCQNVVILKCNISVGDDNVSFKCVPGSPPLDGVLVEGCTFGEGHGASVGSALGSGIRNITVRNCTFTQTHPAIRIKSARDRGAVVENIVYENLKMTNVGTAIYVNMFYFDSAGQAKRETLPVTAKTPIIRNVRIENVTATGAKAAGEITGLPEMPVSDVLMKNVKIEAKKGFSIRDARRVKLENVKITPEEGPALTTDQAELSPAG